MDTNRISLKNVRGFVENIYGKKYKHLKKPRGQNTQEQIIESLEMEH
jgi:hypothetical protein